MLWFLQNEVGLTHNKLTRENYDFVFANFLLGKDIYGPGKYIFGAFDNREIDEIFPVKYNDDDEE